jgi:RimJ/RimL family protein N-acetyltransferase
MDRPTIAAGWLTLRPFIPADIPWVYAVLCGRRADFLAEDTATAARLGRVGLRLGEPGAAEIGYWVDPRARNRGVATSAVRAACQWAVATAGVELIEWRCQAGNVASRRVAEKAGFLIEGTLRKRRLQHGVRVDEWVGSLLRDEVTATSASWHAGRR